MTCLQTSSRVCWVGRGLCFCSMVAICSLKVAPSLTGQWATGRVRDVTAAGPGLGTSQAPQLAVRFLCATGSISCCAHTSQSPAAPEGVAESLVPGRSRLPFSLSQVGYPVTCLAELDWENLLFPPFLFHQGAGR